MIILQNLILSNRDSLLRLALVERNSCQYNLEYNATLLEYIKDCRAERSKKDLLCNPSRDPLQSLRAESKEPYQDKLYLLLLIKTNASHLEMLLLCLPCWTNLKYIHPAHELWMFISTQFPLRIFLRPYYFSVSYH